MWSHGAQLSGSGEIVQKKFGAARIWADQSISNLMESHWSIKGFVAHADYFWQVDH